VHFMMDMQMAYVGGRTTPRMVASDYDYADEQLQRMQDLARLQHPHVLGFAAFDPRREDWCKTAEKTLEMGFKGFKFYPAMGYLPVGNADAVIEQRVLEFFSFCQSRKAPVFAHCTPVGFQTREKLGTNANPAHWRKLLQIPEFSTLALCLGHAGGGKALVEDGKYSDGWVATEETWESPTNYAYEVVKLCGDYPNVYCELRHIVELIEGPQSSRDRAAARPCQPGPRGRQYQDKLSADAKDRLRLGLAYAIDDSQAARLP